jgi:signal peptidase I
MNDEIKNEESEEIVTIENQAAKKEQKKSNFFLEILIYVILILLAVFVVPRYVLQRTVVEGSSMENTLHNNESLLVEKVSKHFTDPKRYDIIIFDPPRRAKEGSDDFFVKRVIGLPGETIQILGDTILINGEVMDENYGKEPMADEDNMTAAEPLKLAEDEFFVLGDNRSVSKDSRSKVLGPIKRDMIVGSMMIRIWPLNRFGIPD